MMFNKKSKQGTFLSFFLFYFCFNCLHAIHSQHKTYKKNNTIVILLHLYNLDLIDHFIIRINKFITLNKIQDFYIKINIPVAENIEKFKKFDQGIDTVEKQVMYQYCLESAPYHKDLITYNNCCKLYAISNYLKKQLIILPEKIQVIFAENRGVDIGGFFLLLDQLIQDNLQYDYIVKLHTKTDPAWRNRLLAILDLDLNKYLPHFDCIYAFRKNCCNGVRVEITPRLALKEILRYYNLPEKEKFGYAAGTMFIASSKMTNFFKKYDRIQLFNQLNSGYNKKNGQIEHGYERFFGYLMELLNLKGYYLK